MIYEISLTITTQACSSRYLQLWSKWAKLSYRTPLPRTHHNSTHHYRTHCYRTHRYAEHHVSYQE